MVIITIMTNMMMIVQANKLACYVLEVLVAKANDLDDIRVRQLVIDGIRQGGDALEGRLCRHLR